MLMYRVDARARMRAKADAIETVFYGYCGAKGGKDGKATRAMYELVEALRRD